MLNHLSYLSNSLSLNNCYKYNTNKNRNQLRNKTFLPNSKIIENVEEFFHGLTPAQHGVLSQLFYLDGKYEVIYVRQDTIASILGVSRQYVNQIIGMLCNVGIIQKTYRHMTSCIYRVSSFFKTRQVKHRLAHIFHVFRLQLLTLFTKHRKCSSIKKGEKYLGGEGHCKIRSSLERIMNSLTAPDSFENPFSPYLEDIAPALKLTVAGKTRMAAFPDEALRFAVQCFERSRNKLRGDYGRWLWSCANNYCKLNDIKPDWKWSNRLAYHHNVEAEASLTDISLPTVKLPTKKPKTHVPKPYVSVLPPVEDPEVARKKIEEFKKSPDLSPFARMLIETYPPYFAKEGDNRGE